MSNAQGWNAAIATGIVGPNDEDWIVRVRMADGSVVVKRVSPPTVSMETAISRVRLALGRRAQVVDVDAMRYSATRKLVLPASAEAT